jgi:hypothetical protein
MNEKNLKLIGRSIGFLIGIVIFIVIFISIGNALIYFNPIPNYKFEEDCIGGECQRSINKQLYEIKNLLRDRNEK